MIIVIIIIIIIITIILVEGEREARGEGLKRERCKCVKSIRDTRKTPDQRPKHECYSCTLSKHGWTF